MDTDDNKPRRESATYAWVSWVVSFLAFYKTLSLEKAGPEAGVTAKTIRDNVRSLESWLHRALMDETDRPPSPTFEAVDFLPKAIAIIELINSNEEVFQNRHRLRVRTDGVCVLDGERFHSVAAAKIGSILLSARNDPAKGTPFVKPPAVDPASIDMSWFEPSADLTEKIEVGKKELDERAERRSVLMEGISDIVAKLRGNEIAELTYLDRKKNRLKLQRELHCLSTLLQMNDQFSG